MGGFLMIIKTLGHYLIAFICLSSALCPFLIGISASGSDGSLRISGWTDSPSTLIVTKLADTDDGTCDKDCSLREALSAAPGDATIAFKQSLGGGTIALKNTLMIEKNVKIEGSAAKSIIISGKDFVRVFYVASGVNFTIINLMITRGFQKGISGLDAGRPRQVAGLGGSAYGGGLYNNGGEVTIANCTFSDNGAVGGFGGVGDFSAGGSGGKGGNGGNALGGGLYNLGRLIVANSTFSGNRAVGGGGGPGGYAGDSGFGGGTGGEGGDGMGGGLYNAGTGSVFLINTTFSANRAVGGNGGAGGRQIEYTGKGGNGGGGYGGAIYSSSETRISSCTIYGNSANGGTGGFGYFDEIDNRVGQMGIASGSSISSISQYRIGGFRTSVRNTLISSRFSGDSCQGMIDSEGYNIDAEGTCGLDGTGDLANVNPKLGSLKNNGGMTSTHALLPGSPAVDAANPAGCTDHNGAAIPTDQRGRSRSGRCDIGAFEFSR
jgi:CSLREA domain-containing protein